ncbi:hypothetical protein U8V72_14295 [Priestia filamentosa]|uniref:hypothetical protein n=1 Tax=Priestia filamentosa TaxID=1402861 RepID=UPI0005896B75
MLSKIIFKGLMHFLQAFTGFVTASLIWTLYKGHTNQLWLDILYVVVSWSILIWVGRKDVHLLEQKFKSYFFDDEEDWE